MSSANAVELVGRELAQPELADGLEQAEARLTLGVGHHAHEAVVNQAVEDRTDLDRVGV